MQLSEPIQQILEEKENGFITLVKTPIKPLSFLSFFGPSYTYQYELKDSSNAVLKTQTITREQYEACNTVLNTRIVSQQVLISKSLHHIVKHIGLVLPFPACRIKKCMLMCNETYCLDEVDSHVLFVLNLHDKTSFKIPFLDYVSIPNLITQCQNIHVQLEFYDANDLLLFSAHALQVESHQHDKEFTDDMFRYQTGPFQYKMNGPFDLNIPNKYLCCEPQVCDTLDHVFRLNRLNIHTICVSLQRTDTHVFEEVNSMIKELVVSNKNQQLVYVYKNTEPLHTIKINVDPQESDLTVSIKCKQSNLQLQLCVFGIYNTVVRSAGGMLIEMIDR